MKVSKTLFSLSVPPQVKGECGSGWEGKRTEFHKSIHSFNNLSLLKMIHNIQDFQKCVVQQYTNGNDTELEPEKRSLAKEESTDVILHRHCKNMLNNINVLVKVLENLVGTLTNQQQQRRQQQDEKDKSEDFINTTDISNSSCPSDEFTEVFAEVETEIVEMNLDAEEGNKKNLKNETTVQQDNEIESNILPNKEKQESEESRTNCRLCHKIFKSKYFRKQHEAHYHTRRDIPCQHCKYIFENQEILAKHVEIFHTAGRNVVPVIVGGRLTSAPILGYKCQHCDELFDQQDKLVEHKSTHPLEMLTKEKETEESLICHICNKVLKSAACFPQHVLEQHPPKKCPSLTSCDKSFKTERGLVSHIKQDHKNEVFEFTCPICKAQDPPPTISYTFPTNALLRAHCRNLHKKEAEAMGLYKFKYIKRNEKCDLCNKAFTSKKLLMSHVSKVHHKEGFTRHICQVCSKVFDGANKLNFHTKTVHSKARAACEKCGASVKSPLYLKAHMQRIHGGEIRVRKMCPHPNCSTVLKDASCAKQHYRRIHTLTKIIKCVLCNKMFKTHLEMRNHLKSKVHTEPNYRRKKRKPVVEDEDEEYFDNAPRKSKRVAKQRQFYD